MQCVYLGVEMRSCFSCLFNLCTLMLRLGLGLGYLRLAPSAAVWLV